MNNGNGRFKNFKEYFIEMSESAGIIRKGFKVLLNERKLGNYFWICG